MPELLILSGLPASGKSTYRKEWLAEDPNRTYINYDELRIELYGEGWKWNRAEENQMKDVAFRRAIEALKAGKSVCIDNTNLSTNVRARWASIGKTHGATVIEQEFDTPVDECVRRDAARTSRVGRAVIERMALFYGFIDWNDYVDDFVIVDIDGTIADCSHRLHYIQPKMNHTVDCSELGQEKFWTKESHPRCPECNARWHKDWKGFFSKVSGDKPIEPIIDLVRAMGDYYNIIFITGRDTSIGLETEEWLKEHFDSFYRFLFMRQSGDNKPDFEMKKEILDHLPKERIRYVLEDRERVVEMYRKEGLTVLQVAKGSY
jgi:predicted kinase